MHKDTLYCFYDLGVSPCSFDFFTFYLTAETCRIRRKLDHIELYLVKGPNGGFREGEVRSKEQNLNFLNNVIVPGISLFPSCARFHLLERDLIANMDLPAVNMFPRGYKWNVPVPEYTGRELVADFIRGDQPGWFDAPDYAKEMARQFCQAEFGGRPFITNTVRELDRQNATGSRSVDVDVWTEITAMDSGYETVIVRDTSKALSGTELIPGAKECRFASIHLPFRVALYQQAACNFIKNNGPGILTFFVRQPGMTFNVSDPAEKALSQDWFRDFWGMGAGDQTPLSMTDTIMVWDQERVSHIAGMLSRLDGFDLENPKMHPLSGPENARHSFILAGGHLLQALQSDDVLEEDIRLYRAMKELEARYPGLPDMDAALRQHEGKKVKFGMVDTLQQAAA